MQGTTELKLTQMYFARTMEQKLVIPIARSRCSADRYLFVSPQTMPTPFVVWSASKSFCDNDFEIDLYQGQYYKNLEDALLYDKDFFGADLESIKSYLSKE